MGLEYKQSFMNFHQNSHFLFQVVAPPNSPACEDKAGQDKDRSKSAQLFMLELLTRINEEKKQFENSVKVANPFGAPAFSPSPRRT